MQEVSHCAPHTFTPSHPQTLTATDNSRPAKDTEVTMELLPSVRSGRGHIMEDSDDSDVVYDKQL